MALFQVTFEFKGEQSTIEVEHDFRCNHRNMSIKENANGQVQCVLAGATNFNIISIVNPHGIEVI